MYRGGSELYIIAREKVANSYFNSLKNKIYSTYTSGVNKASELYNTIKSRIKNTAGNSVNGLKETAKDISTNAPETAESLLSNVKDYIKKRYKTITQKYHNLSEIEKAKLLSGASLSGMGGMLGGVIATNPYAALTAGVLGGLAGRGPKGSFFMPALIGATAGLSSYAIKKYSK